MAKRELVEAGTSGAAHLYASARARIVSATALALLLIAGVAYVPSVLAAIATGQSWVLVLDTVLVGWIATLAALRRKFPRAVAAQLLAFFYLTGAAFLVPFGPASAGLLFLFVVPVFAAVALGMRTAIAALAVNTVTLVAVGALLETGVLVWPYLEPRALWWMITGSFVLLDSVSAISIAVLLRRLRESLAENVELATALEETAELVAITDQRLGLVWANRAFARAVGGASARDVRELLGVLPTGDAERLAKNVAAGESFTGRLTCETREGTILLDVTSTALPGPRPARVFVARDVTHESLLRAELAQAQRLEAIGTLAGGIAHDLNNMMSPVLANAEALRDAQPGQESRELASEIVQSVSRARELLRRVLRATAPSGDTACCDLASVVRDEMRLVAATMPPNVRVSLTVPDVELPVGLSEAEIERVLVNLCVNAAQAMPRGGSLEVVVRRDEGADRSERALLEIADTGSGMSDATKARIFDPFFTTKELGQGTGLGLTGVHQLVRRIGGTIEVESALDRGTTFRIAMPLVAATASRPVAGEPKPAAWQGRRALLVDDDDSVRRALGRSLSRLGIEVDSEADGHSAIRRFRADPKRWDLVITDLTMPETTGLDVLEQIRALSAIPVLVVTGRVDPEVDRRASELGVTALLLKPIATAELRDVLSRCL